MKIETSSGSRFVVQRIKNVVLFTSAGQSDNHPLTALEASLLGAALSTLAQRMNEAAQ